MGGRYNRGNYSTYLNDEPMPDAASEKEQVRIPIPAQNHGVNFSKTEFWTAVLRGRDQLCDAIRAVPVAVFAGQ
jgi:hypothetical protein